MNFENALKKIHNIFQRQAEQGNLPDRDIEVFNQAQKVIIDYYNLKEGNRTNGIPPTLEEVKAYCTERKNKIDPRAFIDFYESKGWYIGYNKMKDWKAAVRTWESRHQNTSKPGKDRGKEADKFNDFD